MESEEGMERLTTRTDICCEPENDIVYYNPKDPDGLYNIIDLAKCVHEVDGEEANILLEISNRLAAYEDTGLTPERIRELQNAFNILFESERQKQQENEQLRAQVAQYREALIIANHRMPDVGQFCACGKCKTCGADINYVGYEHCVKCARVIIDEALSDTPADYHNPSDVELLRKARKALHKGISELKVHCKYFDQIPEEDACIEMHEAVVEIDKAIGGKEDGK